MRNRNRFTRVYFKYITVVILGLMVVLGVVLFAGTRGVNEEPESDTESALTSDNAEGTESVEAAESSGQADEDGTSGPEISTEAPTMPAENTVSALDAMNVTALVSMYYQAKVDDNLDQLNSIVDSDTDYNDTDVLADVQFVDRYDNFNTFVMNGEDEDSFIVYVKYDIFFKGITTGAAALNHFYVVRNESGDLVIYDRPLSAAQQAVLEASENSVAVGRLKEQVEEELDDACESNPDLKYLMAMLNHTTVEPDSPAEETTANAESTEAKTSAADESTTESEGEEDSDDESSAEDDSEAEEQNDDSEDETSDKESASEESSDDENGAEESDKETESEESSTGAAVG